MEEVLECRFDFGIGRIENIYLVNFLVDFSMQVFRVVNGVFLQWECSLVVGHARKCGEVAQNLFLKCDVKFSVRYPLQDIVVGRSRY